MLGRPNEPQMFGTDPTPSKRAVRPPDLAYEALAEVTDSDMNVSRGKLNKALAEIKEQFDYDGVEELVSEIKARAGLYRRLWPELTLTPNALAQNWHRIFEDSARQREAQATNQSTVNTQCDVCDGHRFVLVGTRPVTQTNFQRTHGITPREGAVEEEYAVCPQCNASCDSSFRRHDGTMARALDPEKVRELMNG